MTPTEHWNGTSNVTVTVFDGIGGEDTKQFILTVDPVNDPPVTHDDDVETNEDIELPITLPLADDIDNPNSDLTYIITSNTL